MATTPPYTSDPDEPDFDPSKPFQGVVVCCTSIPPEQRSEIDRITADLGGVHKYDLTPDVTHLIVGDYNTPKYRHVAKERPDIAPMAAGWIEAVRRLWIEAAEINFVALEKEWRLNTFETQGGPELAADSVHSRGRLLCCLTGFDEPDERQRLIDMIEAGGGAYTGDLTKKVTHLIVARPEGKKYTAARNWGVRTVSIEWLRDSVQRGMILDEDRYDPALPADARGCLGSWRTKMNDTYQDRRTSLGKRQREVMAAAENEGKRKLRKTASMKMLSQQQNLWGDILGRQGPAEPSAAAGTAGSMSEVPTQPPNSSSLLHKNGARSGSGDHETTQQPSLGPSEETTVFASCCFFVHGFSAPKTEVLANAVSGLGGLICHSLDEVVFTSGAQMTHRILIVPQASRPESHPAVPEKVHVVTEFFVEKCLHKKHFFDPGAHVLGRPFPAFPLPGLQRLTICTAGFTGVDLHQVDKAVRQLGARYEERFTAQVSLLACASLSLVRPQKLDLALAWNVPVVSAEWLWECVSAGCVVPVNKFMFSELKQGPPPPELGSSQQKPKASRTSSVEITKEFVEHAKKSATSVNPKPVSNAKIRGPDASAFSCDESKAEKTQNRPRGSQQGADTTGLSDQFNTALAHQEEAEIDSFKQLQPAPLSEVSSNAINKSPSPKQNQVSKAPIQIGSQPPPARKSLTRVRSEVADSDATGDDDQDREDENLGLPPADDHEVSREKGDLQLLKRRREEEKAAERAAMSTKLVNLLDSKPIFSGAGDISADVVGALGSSRRRRRGIQGRCVSNVSAGSNGSAESGSVAEGGKEAASRGPSFSVASAGAAGLFASGGIGDGTGNQVDVNKPPVPTQIEWRRRKEAKLTIGEVSGMVNMDRDYQLANSAATARGAAGRTRKKGFC